MRYAFIREQQSQHAVRRLCQMMRVHPSGYYAWLGCPQSRRRRDDEVLLGHIKHAWLESGGVYGYRKVHTDLQELGIDCGKHRVHRLMRAEGLRSQSGYRRRPSPRGGRPSVVAPNRLQQQFHVAEPNQVWVTDITYLRTYEGWLYLAVVLDLFSRQVIGWSMQSRIDRELVLAALLMAVWRRQPKQEVIVHSDQGSQGEFNRSSQHDITGRLRWVSARFGLVVPRCGRQGDLPFYIDRSVGRSGRRLPKVARAKKRLEWPRCRRRSERDGFGSVEVCPHRNFRRHRHHQQDGTCRWLSVSR